MRSSVHLLWLRRARFWTACAVLCVVITPAPRSFAASDVANPDPYEEINRVVFAFNRVLDDLVILPLAKGFRFITPDIVDRGVTNMIANIGELPAVVNDVFQWRWGMAVNDSGRFVINSTVGVFGFFDVAKHWGMERNTQDFGITFGRWGVDAGPYVVLPIVGPSTVRDAVGWVPDIIVNPAQFIDNDYHRVGLLALDVVDTRADLMSADELISGDRYVFLRDAWLQQREYIVTGETPEDDFADEDF